MNVSSIFRKHFTHATNTLAVFMLRWLVKALSTMCNMSTVIVAALFRRINRHRGGEVSITRIGLCVKTSHERKKTKNTKVILVSRYNLYPKIRPKYNLCKIFKHGNNVASSKVLSPVRTAHRTGVSYSNSLRCL